MSYLAGLPVFAVTVWTTLTIVYRSGIKWDMTSGLMFVSIFGWSAGIVPAIIDGVIAVNQVMHNTMWVPGHFHMYLILGLVAMLFGFMYHLSDQGSRKGVDLVAFWLYLVAGTGFSVGLLASGLGSVPRRWAVHLPEWVAESQASSAFAALIVLAALVFAMRFLTSLRHARAG